jgi:hypothetical protein
LTAARGVEIVARWLTAPLLIVDRFDDRAIWNVGVVVFIIIGIAVRPGGIRGRRR